MVVVVCVCWMDGWMTLISEKNAIAESVQIR